MIPLQNNLSQNRPTRKEFSNGFRASIPLGISVGVYGVLFGILAKQHHLSNLEAVGMSMFVFAGTAQFAGLDLWSNPLPLAALFLQMLVINSRHLLMGLSLRTWYSAADTHVRYTSAFLMIDESWALAFKEFEQSKTDPGFLMGSGVAMYVFWAVSTGIGAAIGDIFRENRDPRTWALDTALPCVLVILLIPRWKGRSSILVWLSAAMASALSDRWLPPGWNVLLGALAGTLVGIAISRDE